MNTDGFAQRSTCGSAPQTARPPRTSVWRLPGSPRIVAGRSSKPTKTLASRARRVETSALRSTRCSRTPYQVASRFSLSGSFHSARQERPARRQRDGGNGCRRSGTLFRPQVIDRTSPFGKAIMQMACVFGELEREMIRARVVAGLNRVREQGLKRLGRPQVGRKIEEAIRKQLREQN